MPIYYLQTSLAKEPHPIINSVLYETCNKQPLLYMNPCTMQPPDGKMGRERPDEVESGHESVGCVTA